MPFAVRGEQPADARSLLTRARTCASAPFELPPSELPDPPDPEPDPPDTGPDARPPPLPPVPLALFALVFGAVVGVFFALGLTGTLAVGLGVADGLGLADADGEAEALPVASSPAVVSGTLSAALSSRAPPCRPHPRRL